MQVVCAGRGVLEEFLEFLVVVVFGVVVVVFMVVVVVAALV